jgi:hypothetical protein
LATKRQIEAARANIKKAQEASRKKRKIAHDYVATRKDVGKKLVLGRKRGEETGRALEERNRQQIYALASHHGIRGRATMGKSELIAAIRKAL